MKPKHVLIVLSLILLVNGCDIYQPQKKFRLAIPEADIYYSYVAENLKAFLELHGYSIEIVPTAGTAEANKMVAENKADLSLISNLSLPTTELIGPAAGKLRTVIPLTSRILFAFSKEPVQDHFIARDLLSNKRLGIESLGGEADLNFKMILSRTKIEGAQLVSLTDNPDVFLFWGSLYGVRAQKFLSDGWHPFSFKENFIKFLTLNEPSLKPFSLPAIPGDPRSVPINSVSTETILVTNRDIGENAVYLLANLIYHNRMELIHKDAAFREISDNFDGQSYLFPVHDGTEAFLLRHQPTFFERYADLIAMLLSVAAVFYGTVQAIRNNLLKRRRVRIDKYYLEFLSIRQNNQFDKNKKVSLLNDLLQRALEQMTNEKLDKSDSHMISSLIQQEITIMRFRED